MEKIKIENAILYDIPELKKQLLNISIHYEQVKKEAVKNDMLIILDNSGSMSGSPISSAKNGISYILSNANKQLKNSYIMTFNSATKLYKLNNDNDNVQEILNKIHAEGGTDFRPVFSEMKKLFQSFENNLSVIFFTDGCGTYTKENISELKDEISKLAYNCKIYTIGFSSSHDAALLSQLTQVGSVIGTFQYIEKPSDITQAMESLLEAIVEQKLYANISVGNKQIGKIQLEAVTDENNLFNGELVISEKIDQNLTDAVVEINDEKLGLNFIKSDEEISIGKMLKCINLQILEFINVISKGNVEKSYVDFIKNECTNYDEILKRFLINGLKMKLSFSERKALKQEIYAIQTLVNEFQSNFLTQLLTSRIENAKIASLNDLAYGLINKRSLKTKLDKRTQDNIDLFDELDRKVEDLVKKIDFKSLNENDFKEKCIITCLNYTEALENGDCLCITLDVERPEAAIMDPSRVIVKDIFPSIISAEAFLDSVQFVLGNTDKPEACHGGFNKSTKAQLISGQGRENITAAMPLFINSTHWSIAKQKMKPIMGWICTLNVLGYNYEQVITVPFTVLAKSLNDLNQERSEFKIYVHKLLLDTCMAIYRDSPAIKEHLFDESGKLKFLNNPIERTVDCVPNLTVYLVKLMCAIKNGDFNLTTEQMKLLIESVIEEDYRRRQSLMFLSHSESSIETDQILYNMLGVSKEEDIDSKVSIIQARAKLIFDDIQTFLKENIQETSDLDNLTDEQIEALKDLQTKNIDPLISLIESLKSDKCPRLDNDHAKEILKKFNKFLSKQTKTLQTILSNLISDTTDSTNFVKTTIQELTSTQILAIIAQNFHGQKNPDRRHYIEEGNYIDPFEKSSDLLTREYHRIVDQEIRKHASDIRSKCVNCFSEILFKNKVFYMYSNAVVQAVGEFFRSIPHFNTEDDY